MGKGLSVRGILTRAAFVAALLLSPPQAAAATAQPTQNATISPVWGSLADLAGTTWRNTKGTLKTFAWKIPNELLHIDYHDGSSDTISLDPSGDTLTYKGTTNTTSAKAARPGVILFGSGTDQQVMRVTADRMFQEATDKNGAPVIWESSRVPAGEVAQAIAAKQQARAALTAAGDAAKAKLADRAARLLAAKDSHGHQYGHLTPPDHDDYLNYTFAMQPGTKTYDLTLFSCAPNADFRSKNAQIISKDQRAGAYYVTTLRAAAPGSKIKYVIDAGSDATVGEPFLVLGRADSQPLDLVLLEEMGPKCASGAPLSQQEIAARFGDYLSVIGKTHFKPNAELVYDVKWLREGYAFREGCRQFGAKRGRDWCRMYSYDEKHKLLWAQAIYHVGENKFVGNKLTGYRVVAWQDDQRQHKAENAANGGGGGGLFGKILQGAVGGLQGMADAGAGMSEALAGAAIGAAAGAAGVDAASISQSMYEGTAKVTQDNAKLREIMETGTADALARGTAEYNRRQAAAGSATQAASNSVASGSSSSVASPTAASRALAPEPQKTGYLWCYAYDMEGASPVKGTIYSSNVATFSHSHLISNDEATKQPFKALVRGRLRGTGEPGACYVEESMAGMEAFKKSTQGSFPSAKWEDVSFTPTFVPVSD